MSDTNKVRLGIIGLGYMAQGVHIPCFARTSDCEIVAVADKDADLACRVAKKWQIPKHGASEQELLESDEIDAVAILIPPQFIASTAIRALEYGKHVFCEKPIALTEEVNRAVIKAAREAERNVFVAFQKRYDSGVQYVKNLLADEKHQAELGRITYARFHNFCGSFRGELEQPYEKSETQVDYASLGSMDMPNYVDPQDEDMFFCSYVNASHDLNLMRHLLGQPKKAAGGFRIPGPNPWFPYSTTLFDYGDYCSTFEYGLMEHNDFDEEFQIYFERGWIKVSFSRVLLQGQPAQVEIMTKSRGVTIPPIPYAWSFQRQAEHFLRCCLRGDKPLTDAEDTLGDTRMAKMWYLAGKETSSHS